MSYYRYITGLYKSYWPELNRTLRSSSVPRSVPDLDTGRFRRASSLPPSSYYSNSFFSSSTSPSHYSYSPYTPSSHSATPFLDRARSVPPSARSEYSHYSDFDCKVLDYMGRLERDDRVRTTVRQSRSVRPDHRSPRIYPSDSFSSKYNYYDGNKHSQDYLYPCTTDLLGSWKHYNLSSETINKRNTRATSPLMSRELNRYFDTKKRSNYIGDLSSGGLSDFRFYNYRRVPYFGGSDSYQYMRDYKPNGKRRNLI